MLRFLLLFVKLLMLKQKIEVLYKGNFPLKMIPKSYIGIGEYNLQEVY